jgi:DNA-binding IclR family transcriptional regulator
MAGLDRYVAILRVFDQDHPSWTVQALAERLDMPASTVYRTLRELVRNDFVVPATEAQYRLGKAFIEYDRILRLTDPLMQAGVPVLKELVAKTELSCAGILCSLYADHVMCIADAVNGQPSFSSKYERGRPMPLTRNATSQAILAVLPPRHYNKVMANGWQGTSDKAELKAFRKGLAKVRRQGYCIAHGEVAKGLVGLAAPVAASDGEFAASLCLILNEADLTETVERRLVLLLVASASLLSEALKARNSGK